MKNMILNELDDDILDHISAGTDASDASDLDYLLSISAGTDASDASDLDYLLRPVIGICSNCGARVMLGGGPCSRCGVTPAAP